MNLKKGLKSKMIRNLIICATFIFSVFGITNTAFGGDKMNYVYEIVTWKSKEGVSDADMISAVDSMVEDLKQLDGFINQTLYKEKDGQWVDVYYWVTEKNAVDSNDAMANKDSFKSLIELIEPSSVGIKILDPLQTSGEFQLK